MVFPRPTAKLRRALTLGAGFGVARRLLQGLTFDAIARWLVRSFGTLSERELLSLVDHGREMRDAGIRFSGLGPGSVLDFSNIPVNPFLSPTIAEGARVISELVVPWQNVTLGTENEWYWRVRAASEPAWDEFQEIIEGSFAVTLHDTEIERLQAITEFQIDVGGWQAVSIVRRF